MNATTTETIRKEIFVDASPDTAFRVFTEQIAEWWPLVKYGTFGEEAESVTFEDRDPWALVERAKDGRETVWGQVLDYEFASRLRMTWHPGRDSESMPTEVELTFTADGDGTSVVLEHRGWENATEEVQGVRGGYAEGWDEVLDTFRKAS